MLVHVFDTHVVDVVDLFRMLFSVHCEKTGPPFCLLSEARECESLFQRNFAFHGGQLVSAHYLTLDL